MRIGVAVEEHGQLELVARPLGERERGVDRFTGRGAVERDERHHVERAEARVHARVRGEVDALRDRARKPSHHLLGVVRTGTGKGEHRSVMVGIDVHVEQ